VLLSGVHPSNRLTPVRGCVAVVRLWESGADEHRSLSEDVRAEYVALVTDDGVSPPAHDHDLVLHTSLGIESRRRRGFSAAILALAVGRGSTPWYPGGP
jgi:hypothetical protein